MNITLPLRFLLRIGLLILLALMFSACESETGKGVSAARNPVQVPVLSISASIATEPPPANEAELLQRYIDTRALVEALGANGQFVSFHWNTLETRTGVYPSGVWNQLASDMADAEARGLTQLFGLQVINTVVREVAGRSGQCRVG